MNNYVLALRDTDQTKFALAGGKGANLGELARIGGIRVPEGFCVTTEAYKRITADNREFGRLLDELTDLRVNERDRLSSTCAAIRAVIESIPIPEAIAKDVEASVASLGENDTFAVRSSATAEDLPTASFAGQQDSYLNIIGVDDILKHISKCWASLFTDRAVIYRLQNGFDHRQTYLAVVIQRMVFPAASGILFTADPVTGNRKLVSIDASFGLGEAVVAGVVSADCYKVRGAEIAGKMIATKKLGIYSLKEGGTVTRPIDADQQKAQALSDQQIVDLARLGRHIEGHFGRPQDIEWCLTGGDFYIVQSRPITTLFPMPVANDAENHVYVSVGHQQMMTDAFKPLGLSVWQHTAARPMPVAGGRLFVDVAADLASPAKREMLVNVLGKSDPLIRGAFASILERGDFIKTSHGDEKDGNKNVPPVNYEILKDYDPAIVGELIGKSQAAIAEVKQDIQTRSGPELVQFILDDISRLQKELFDRESIGVFMTAINATHWINEKMKEWLDEKNVADTLTLSVPNNITSEMGLALVDVADVIRPYPEVVEYLQRVKDDPFFLAGLAALAGGRETRDAILAFLDKYGMRCAGEIDITKTRWSENPAILAPILLSNIKNLEAGASQRKLEEGRQLALQKEQELLQQLRLLPDGEEKAKETKRMIDLVRNLIGYREYPKYSKVSRYFVYKQALLKEAGRLVDAGVIADKQDIYYLTLEELGEVVRTRQLDPALLAKRKDEYRSFEKMTAPRVFTSDGEILKGRYNREDLSPGALVGIAVSSGMIEGRARVIVDMADANFEEGDILVTAFTDPSWTSLFLSIKGLVTEVGGLMTHGAVIAREYGLPAVVGVEDATKLIKDGQRIRVNGTDGYVEVL